MKKSVKKVLSLIMTAVMLMTVWLCSSPIRVSAADVWNGNVPSSATGFSNNHISSAAGFVWFIRTIADGTDYSGVTVYLDVDIDLNNVNFGNTVFPYNDGRYFRGTFDGQNKTISNIKIEDSNHRVAIFRQTEGATFRNINFNNVNIKSTANDNNGHAVLVGFHNSGNLTFNNIHVNSGTIGGGKYVGALVGEVKENSGKFVTITNCSNAATITGTGGKGVGGLAGYCLPAVNASYCTNTGNVTGNSTDVGGIVGWIEDDASSFVHCENYGCIQGTESIGGILGYSGGPVTAEACTNYANAAITGNKYVGGIVGNESANSSGNKLILTNCSNAATITCSNDRAGGIAGSSNPMVEANYCSNTGNVTGGSTDVGGIVGWIEDDPSGFNGCSNSGKIQGSDSIGGILGYIGNNSKDQKLTLTSNLNTGEIISINRAGGIAGCIDTDNNAHIITSNVNRGKITAGTDAGGIVAFNKGFGTWENNDNYGDVTASGDNSGGICGEIEDDAQTFTDCHNYATVVGKYSTGGVIGYAPKSLQTFTRCKNTGDVTSTGGTAAGIYGYGTDSNSCGRFYYCENEGNIYSSSGPAGGLSGRVGNKDNDPVFYYENCINRGTITSNGSTDSVPNAGGLAGYINSDATHVFSNNYNYGTIKGLGESGGGLVGKNMGAGTWTACYNYGVVEDCIDNAGGIAGEIEDDAQSFTDCHNFGKITAANSSGGILGYGPANDEQYHTFTNCDNSGAITSTANYHAGGIMGYGEKQITCTECWNIGTIKSTKDAGGLLGHVSYHTFFNRCWNAGEVGPLSGDGSGYSYGGLIGYTSYFGNNESQVMVTDCYNWGYISGGFVGGFVGSVNESRNYIIIYSYNTGLLNGVVNEGQFVGLGGSSCCGTGCYKHINTNAGGIYKTDQEFIDYNFTIDNNFSKNTEGVTINGTTYYYPILKWCQDSMPSEDPSQNIDLSKCLHNDNWTAQYDEENRLCYTCDTCGYKVISEYPVSPLQMLALPMTAGSTLQDGKIYNVSENVTISGSTNQNGLIVPIKSTVVINIPTGIILTVNGGDANGQTPGKAGILVPSSSTLIITGGGTLNVNSGNGGNGSNGAGGGAPNGGAGGAGGGGGGAGIGGNGGIGGAGGNGGGDNGNGGNGGIGYGGGNTGKIYILATVDVNASAVGSTGSGGSGGGGNSGSYNDRGGGGGAGGGGGYGGYAIGGGGGAGGGGGGGAGGDWGRDIDSNKGRGGSGGADNGADGTNSGTRNTGGAGGSHGSNGTFLDFADDLSSNDPRVSAYLTRFVFLNNQNGNTVPDVVKVYIDGPMPSVSVPSKDGYTFCGYYSQKNGNGIKYYNDDGSSAHPADFETGELYADWIIQSYSVSANFWKIDGNVSVADTVVGTIYSDQNSVAVTVERPALTVKYNNQTLNWLGFTTEDTAGPTTAYSEELTRIISGGENFNSLYYGNITLTFNGNGGASVPSSQVSRQYVNANANGIYRTGSSFTIGAGVPVKTGFTFLGWSLDSNATTAEYDPGDDITDLFSNTTLYAVWTPNVCYAKYNANGGTGTMSQSTHYYGVPSQLSANKFSLSCTVTYKLNDGRPDEQDTAIAEFDGWATTSSGDVVYAPEQTVTNLAKANGVTVNLFAHWLKGSVRLPNATRVGYTFSGWYTNASCTDLAGGGGDYYTPNTNVTLYAKWEPKSYIVSYNGNGATGGSTTASTHVYDQSSALSTNGFIKGYNVSFVYNGATGGSKPNMLTVSSIFTGWALSSDGPIIYTNEENVVNLAESGVVTLYATWRPGSIVLPVPEKDNKIFDGWYYDADLSRKAGDAGDDFTTESEITLYAKWRDYDSPTLIAATDSSTVIDRENGLIYGLVDRDTATLNDLLISNFVAISGGSGYITYDYSNADNVIGTGTKVNLYRSDDVLMETYTVIIYGDNNGDGYVNLNDCIDFDYYSAWLSSEYEYEDMTIANVRAMDIDGDGAVTSNDILVIAYYSAWLIDSIDQSGTGTQL